MCTLGKETGARLRRWEPWPLEPAEGPEQETEGRRDHGLANGVIWVNR